MRSFLAKGEDPLKATAFVRPWISPRMMTAVLVAVLMALFALQAAADPILTCDPQTGVTKYQMRLAPVASPTVFGAWGESTATTAGAAWVDVGVVPPGTYRGEIQAYGFVTVKDSASGVTTTASSWSQSAFFDLSSSSGNKPANLKATRTQPPAAAATVQKP